MNPKHPFKWHPNQLDIQIVRRQVGESATCSVTATSEEMMLERGLTVDHTTVYRWVQA